MSVQYATPTTPLPPRRRGPRLRTRTGSFFLNALTLLAAVVWVFPVYWMVNSSLQSYSGVYGANANLVPFPFSVASYGEVLADSSFWRAMSQSATVTAIAVVVSLFSAVLAAAALSRFRFRSKRAVLLTILIVQMIPAEALFIAQYRMMDGWGLINSVVGLALLYAGASIPITIWMLKGFVDGIPYELEEAAQIDGCSRFGAFMRVTMPLLAPGFVASGVFALLASWNEYTLALVVMTDPGSLTLPLWLRRFSSPFEATDWGAVMAGSALIAIPVIIVFMFVQSRMATGLTGGSVKG
ncbi:carbohydrate ABC transporter membrane protein 2 (CUT1 family) [Microbacterium sp. AG1240]|uniref:carbohydrate ABC transporter permease n=1 Tax=Microbacterium sp. AG1240 TaxID=2183992 RepID=UPI000EB2E77E|nr:carbohydrate ABC transporter permease [Microbacterium sp. AG1240]RKT31626.1 carbohydrate ABC transporter membrane protein 2 (CUT1 family) [Microbacterium sp. AG1240]